MAFKQTGAQLDIQLFSRPPFTLYSTMKKLPIQDIWGEIFIFGEILFSLRKVCVGKI